MEMKIKGEMMDEDSKKFYSRLEKLDIQEMELIKDIICICQAKSVPIFN